MKNQILLILLICFIGCRTDNNKPNKQEEKKIKKQNKSVFFDDHGDTIKPQTFYLKNNYKLFIFPSKDSIGKNDILNYKIISKNFEKPFLLSEDLTQNHILYYEGIDFQNYFALHSNSGTKNYYFWLYDKHSGQEVLTDSYFKIQLDFDLKNELILYTDEDNGYKKFIYDIKTKTKTLVDIPKSFTDKQECTRNDYFEKSSYIKRVSDKYYFIAFKDCPLAVEFKVKKSK